MHHTEAKARLTALLAEHKITMQATFVPFSRSRNKGEKTPSLNWTIALAKNGCEFLATDYMQGSCHCPGYKQGQQVVDGANAIRWECESGKRCRVMQSCGWVYGGKPINSPDIADVFSCLLSDAVAIDYATFKDYARDFGGNPDSIKEEKMYRTCLETALKLRAALGDALVREMQELSAEM